MERVSRETWSKRVERWKDSGLTAAEYAAEAGINAHSLSWWKWRLGSNGATPKLRPGRRSPQGAESEAITPLTFVELASPGSVSSVPIEVILPTGVRVLVPPAFDSLALARVIDVLQRHR